MNHERIPSFLYDILSAVQEVESYFTDIPQTYEHYVKDNKTKSAVERQLEIIGEAMNRIMRIDENFPLEQAWVIIGLRNKIAHGYDTISDEIIWKIIWEDLPPLKAEVEALLNGCG